MACSKPFRKINVDAHTHLWQNRKNNQNLYTTVTVRNILITIDVENNACRGKVPLWHDYCNTNDLCYLPNYRHTGTHL